MTSDQARAAFEAHVNGTSKRLQRDPLNDGNYVTPSTRQRWFDYQAGYEACAAEYERTHAALVEAARTVVKDADKLSMLGVKSLCQLARALAALPPEEGEKG